MTLPRERKNAIESTYRFLLDLLNPKKTPKVPRYIRDRAAAHARHYPGSGSFDFYYTEKAELSELTVNDYQFDSIRSKCGKADCVCYKAKKK